MTIDNSDTKRREVRNNMIALRLDDERIISPVNSNSGSQYTVRTVRLLNVQRDQLLIQGEATSESEDCCSEFEGKFVQFADVTLR